MGRDPKRQRMTVDDDESSDSDDDDDDSVFGGLSSPYLAINMLDDTSQTNYDLKMYDNLDPWMKAAITLSASIDEVSAVIERKAESYVSSIDTLNICFNNQFATESTMTNADRSILETTVASFAAGMAKQIESLRKTVVVEGDHPFMSDNNVNTEPGSSHHWASGQIGHRVGIAACLMQRLKSEIMDPMTSLQSQREKFKNDTYCGDEALDIAQNPLRLFRLDTEATLHRPLPPAPWEVGHHDAEKDRAERKQEEDEFLNVYCNGNEIMHDDNFAEKLANYMSPPPSVMRFMDLPNPSPEVTRTSKQNESLLAPPTHQPVIRQSNAALPYEEDEGEHMVQLQRESATLLATYQHSDLEGVQKVERSMVEITSLLSRFTDLMIEQQDSVLTIHDQALKSKENVDKGQDQLVDAANRGEKSKHPMATFIFSMAVLLLFFNWIIP